MGNETDAAHVIKAQNFDVVVVGAGFAGLYAVHTFRRLGYSVLGIEAGEDVGGTWYWNRYPGARCDVPSLQYAYSFSNELQAEWEWSERYAAQPEILRYLQHVADRFDLRQSFIFSTRVTKATFNEHSDRWTIETDKKNLIEARYCIMATGCLSVPQMPRFEGAESFKGHTYHTGYWPKEGVNFSGQRVGVIGTGSSAVQAIPEIARQAKDLFVFQRTPSFSVPARNKPLSAEEKAEWRRHCAELRKRSRETRSGMLYDYGDRSALDVSAEVREAEYERRWKGGGTNFLYAYNDLTRNEQSNNAAAEFVRRKISESVQSAQTAELLKPRQYPIGTKRICVDTGYYETFNLPHVHLIDVRRGAISFTPQGLRVGEHEYELDSVILATGFDAMTGALKRIDITGKDGQKLQHKWEEGPRTYLGLMTAGFPNFFIITGPGSPSVLSNMVLSVEDHVDWSAELISLVDGSGKTRIEATQQAEDQWVAHVADVASQTLYPRASSWFMGANVPGKPRVFMPYVGGYSNYRQKCRDIIENGCVGFSISSGQGHKTA